MIQLTFTDLYTGCGQPDWPDCWKTCKNFSNEMADGTLDYFMDWARDVPDLNHPRCVRHEGKPKLINNVWYNPCKRYEPIKEAD